MHVLYHSCDVETTCRQLGHGSLMSVGLCAMVVDEKTNTIVDMIGTTVVNIRWPFANAWDAATAALWRKHPHAYARNQQHQVSPERAAALLAEDICRVRELAQDNKWGYALIMDNPAFDLLWLDYFMAHHAPDMLPFRHNHATKKYIYNMVDVAQRKRAYEDLGIDLRLKEFTASVPHDHTPGHDAQHTIEE